MARISDQTYINAYIRQEGLCAVCGEPLEYSPAEAHHMLRVADGGSNSDENIVILCDREEHIYMHGGDFREPVMTTPDDYPYFYGKSGKLEYEEPVEDAERSADESKDQDPEGEDDAADNGGM